MISAAAECFALPCCLGALPTLSAPHACSSGLTVMPAEQRLSCIRCGGAGVLSEMQQPCEVKLQNECHALAIGGCRIRALKQKYLKSQPLEGGNQSVMSGLYTWQCFVLGAPQVSGLRSRSKVSAPVNLATLPSRAERLLNAKGLITPGITPWI